MTIYEAVFWLIALHFIADFQLQSDFISRSKVPGTSTIWPIVLSAHAAMHGVMVAIIVGPVLGLAEFVLHWVVDLGKSSGAFGRGTGGFYFDQSLHLVSKFVWLALALAGVPTGTGLFS